MTLVSVVVPLYNEEEAIRQFHGQLSRTLGQIPHQCEVLYVDDGSTDRTASMVGEIQREDPRVQLIELSRNFGHQTALTAGLDHARGDVVITMDGDGQHPPEILPQMLDLYDEGYDLVLTQRHSDSECSTFKRLTSHLFYRLINLMSRTYILPNSADFRLMSREVVDGLRQVREQHRFIRGVVAWMGFRCTVIHFKAMPRIAGQSRYSLRKMLRLAADAVFSFSTVPLKLALWMGLLLLLLSSIELAWVFYLVAMGRQGELVPGWTTLMLVLLSIGGVQLIILGLLGQYVGLIFQEVKRRPLYFVKGPPRVAPIKGPYHNHIDTENSIRTPLEKQIGRYGH